MHDNILKDDLEYILKNTSSIWNELKNQNLFITGGTGFIGCWLLETIAWANQTLNLNLQTTILTRNKAAFAKKAPHLANHCLFEFHSGDVRDFTFPEKKFKYIIHGATEASKYLNDNNPNLMFDTILEGTARTLEFSKHSQANKFLLISSGAVYGKQPHSISHIPEDFNNKIPLETPYAKGKLAAENMSLMHANQNPIQIKIARCFAFVGPYLPIDIHFAIGNFIRDVLSEKEIFINGDGTPLRSYQYAADLVIWLLHILCHGEPSKSYNVGSDNAISIFELAQTIAKNFNTRISVAKKSNPNTHPERYIPAIHLAQQDLKLKNNINLEDAIIKTINWHINRG